MGGFRFGETSIYSVDSCWQGVRSFVFLEAILGQGLNLQRWKPIHSVGVNRWF